MLESNGVLKCKHELEKILARMNILNIKNLLVIMVISHIQNWFLEPVKNIIKRQYKKHKKARTTPMHADIMHHPYQIFQ